MNSSYHIPALLKESIDGLSIKPDGIYVDVTFGGGGHSREILSKLNKKGKLIAFDQDEDAIENIISDPRFIFVRSNFKYLQNFLKYHGIEKVNGILADLGVSSHHFDEEERGFSFRFDTVLDMRMNKNNNKTAADILNNYTQEKLADIFYLYGELNNARQIAKKIVEARGQKAFHRTYRFLEVIKPFFSKEKEKKNLAKVFQALRIEVNDELSALRYMLEQATKVLEKEGRLVIITYHSLEDRLVKNFIKSGNFDGILEKDFFGNILAPLQAENNKVIIPTKEEIENNPRARSAKLRIATKKTE
jgi:16S rRNA (cytosine1402-N4)-methyltransferase